MNEQAEYILIGSILKDNSILDELTITPEHFEDLQNQNIFRAMLNIKKKGFPIDGASLKDDMGESAFHFIGGNPRLQELKDCVPSVQAFKSYEQMVINQWKINTSRMMIKETLENLNLDKVQTLIKDLSKIDEEGSPEEFNLDEHLIKMQNLIMIETPKKQSGITSGYKDIDLKTDGFQKNDFVIIGARPSMGKTAFSLNLALNAAQKANAIPIYFSLEMSAESLIKRMLSRMAEINGMKLKNPYHYLTDAEKESWTKQIGELGKLDLKIYDKPAQKVSEMRAKVRKIKHDYPDRDIIVFIDYLTLIKPASNHKGNMHSQMTEISADLKNLAKEYECPVICLAQLSRAVEQRADKRPMMSDLRESGSIEQDADIIMMLYRDEYYNEPTQDNRNVLEVGIEKNRDGEVGQVKLMYKKELNRIENFYHYHNK